MLQNQGGYGVLAMYVSRKREGKNMHKMLASKRQSRCLGNTEGGTSVVTDFRENVNWI